MTRLLQRCTACQEYTLQTTCPRCGALARPNVPPKYSPEDRYGEYRRRLKRESGAVAGGVGAPADARARANRPTNPPNNPPNNPRNNPPTKPPNDPPTKAPADRPAHPPAKRSADPAAQPPGKPPVAPPHAFDPRAPATKAKHEASRTRPKGGGGAA